MAEIQRYVMVLMRDFALRYLAYVVKHAHWFASHIVLLNESSIINIKISGKLVFNPIIFCSFSYFYPNIKTEKL